MGCGRNSRAAWGEKNILTTSLAVEVVKGPSGTLYGLAIAGVVNLHTARPEKGRTSVACIISSPKT